MSVNVWANSRDVPGYVCSDARLTERSEIHIPFMDRPLAVGDRLYGQAGWQIGVNFRDLADLARQLKTLPLPSYLPGGGRPIRHGEIQRLAIHAHGAAGTIFINGQDDARTLTAQTVNANHAHLHEIGLMTPDSPSNPAVILFVGCLAGGTRSGTELLIALSRVWPNRKVVAFATLGYAPGGRMLRSGQGCSEPGMRDTNALYPGEADANVGRYWEDLASWPWASESSARAKVALNGAIILGANW